MPGYYNSDELLFTRTVVTVRVTEQRVFRVKDITGSRIQERDSEVLSITTRQPDVSKALNLAVDQILLFRNENSSIEDVVLGE